MLLRRERELLVAHARRLRDDGLAVGTAGNLSLRAGGRLLITPSGIDYEDLTPDLVCVLTEDGGRLEAGPPPSTELATHLAAYRATGAAAVVHAHPPAATALGTVAESVPAVHYLVVFLGGPVPVVPYAPPGSEDLAAAVVRALEGRSAVLLRNHGSLTTGGSLEAAYARSVLLEWLCDVYQRARLVGEPAVLSEADLADVADRLRDYGPWGG